MVKKKTSRKTKTSLQREVAKLKKEKAAFAKKKKQFVDRKREIEEIKKLKRDIAKLKGVGTKREVAKKLGAIGARTGFKGLKIAGKFVKNIIEAEAREQARDRVIDRAKAKRKKRK